MTPLEPPKPDRVAIALRVFVYVFLVVAGIFIFSNVLSWVAPVPFVVATLSTFAAAAVANAIALRIWAHGQLADIGMEWTPASRWNLLIGFGGGLAAGLLASLLPLAFRVASLERAPNATVQWGSLAFVTVLLLFGAVGEEMLFRGYAFQFLIGRMGAYATILPFGVLFGLMHGNNPNQSWLGLFNTAAWGVLFGYAFLRSGDLWLPIGLHFGWNWVLPLLGGNLSGYTMGETGLIARSKAGSWWTGGNYGPEAGVFTTMAVVGLFFYLRRTPVQRQRSVLARLPEEDES
jgi:membrane protease YdiL (CAAX protease family)